MQKKGSIGVAIENLPQKLLDRIFLLLSKYTTCFVGEKFSIGSGTFIKCKDVYGILTAYHVVHGSMFQALKEIRLNISEGAHSFGFKKEVLEIVDIGIPKCEEYGPDLSVVILPSNQIGHLLAKRSFFDISLDRAQRIEDTYRGNKPFFLCGFPAGWEEIIQVEGSLDKIIRSRFLSGPCRVRKRGEKACYDYFEIAAVDSPTNNLPYSFEGVSGGGLWQTPLRIKNSSMSVDQIYFNEKDIILSGTAFYETSKNQGKRMIRCHAAKSIYEIVYQKLISR